ncbi:retrovirus-related pol polyprotein from transposon TNT 1-94 [Tanacetum coccineum]|uniref:Retrovirus-related pol polyprotein from transposon TNT 1-94 n=1 Tax=Tanacetum coccineum TaxID=301880 RepID=A0ABQ5C7H3_9ASTR
MKDKVMPNNSQMKFKKTKVEDHHRISSISNKTKTVTACNDSLKSRYSNVNVFCATCGKCVFNLNHDAYVSKFLNKVNARTKKPKVVPISTRQPKSQEKEFVTTPPKKAVASESTIQKSKRYYRMLYEKTKTTSSTPICFMAKASLTQAWLWHRRLSHLNFDYINLLSKKDIVIGLPKLKYVKDQLCSSCEVSKAKKKSIQDKGCSNLKGRLNLLHMDLCGPMRVESINGKKYILGSSVLKRQRRSDYDNSDLAPQLQNVSPSADITASSQQELDLLFGPLYDVFFNAAEICIVRVHVSTAEPKNIKEAMADSAWIEAMLEDLHKFDRTTSLGNSSTKPFADCIQAKGFFGRTKRMKIKL